MAISFNTGVSNDSGGGTAANVTLTIPAGVLGGDVILFVAEGFDAVSGATLSASSTGTSPILLDQNQTAGTNNGLFGNGAVWYFIASATDAGKVITITASGAMNPFWSASLAAYTGAASIDVHGGVAAESTTGAATSTPALTTGVAGDWAIYLAGLGIPAGGTSPAINEPSGTTSRQKHEASSSICSDICDSNASVGPAGTGIGGSGKQYSPSSPPGNTWYNLFTVGLSPAVAAAVTPSATPGATWKRQFKHRQVYPVPSLVTPATPVQGPVPPAYRPQRVAVVPFIARGGNY